MIKLGGLKSVDPYFQHPPAYDPNAPKPPDPKMVEANAKAQATQQANAGKHRGGQGERRVRHAS
jgi:hypothetical protein